MTNHYPNSAIIGHSSIVVAVQAVGSGTDLTFGPPQALQKQVTKAVEADGRLRPVTLPPLLRGGARQFCWVAPGESLACGNEKCPPSATGAFLYMCADDAPPIYFKLALTTSLAGRTMSALRENVTLATLAGVLAVGVVVGLSVKTK